jgi:hypothetical protein
VIRASIHQVLDKAWLEVEQYRLLDGRPQWTSIGRCMMDDIDEIGNMGEAAGVLIGGLDMLLDDLKAAWHELDAYRT